MNIVMRPMPEISTPSDAPDWNWEKVKAVLETQRSFFAFYALLFQPWQTVIAPKGMPCNIMTLDGRPIYQFKYWRKKTYLLQPAPGMGFPGS